MRALRLAMAAALLALAWAPSGAAQDPTTIVVDHTDPAGRLDPNGTTELAIRIDVGCAVLLQNPTATAIVVTSPDAADAKLTVEETSFDVSAAPGCLTPTPGVVIVEGGVPVTPQADTPGMVPLNFTLEATLGTTPVTHDVSVVVDYRPGHTYSPGDGTVFEVRGGTHTFDLTEEFTGNARSMIMFEDFNVPAGSLEGWKLQIRDPPATETFPLTFTAPAGEWDEVQVSFKSYSHYIDPASNQGSDEYHDIEHPVWTFRNAGGGEGTPTEPTKKDSPAAGALLAFGIVACALLARRLQA